MKSATWSRASAATTAPPSGKRRWRSKRCSPARASHCRCTIGRRSSMAGRWWAACAIPCLARSCSRCRAATGSQPNPANKAHAALRRKFPDLIDLDATVDQRPAASPSPRGRSCRSHLQWRQAKETPCPSADQYELILNLKAAKALGSKYRRRCSLSLTKRSNEGVDVSDWPWLCKNSRRYNRTRNFGLYGHAESKKRKNLSSARHYDQIRFRFHTTKAQSRRSERTDQCLSSRELQTSLRVSFQAVRTNHFPA